MWENRPLVILNNCTSFSQDAKEAFNTSVSFLLVPGVSGGICVGASANKIVFINQAGIIKAEKRFEFI